MNRGSEYTSIRVTKEVSNLIELVQNRLNIGARYRVSKSETIERVINFAIGQNLDNLAGDGDLNERAPQSDGVQSERYTRSTKQSKTKRPESNAIRIKHSTHKQLENYIIRISAAHGRHTKRGITFDEAIQILLDSEHNRTRETAPTTDNRKQKVVIPNVPNLNPEAWTKLILYRRKRGLAKYATDRKAVALAALDSPAQMDCVDQCIENNWHGPWPDNFKPAESKQDRINRIQQDLDAIAGRKSAPAAD